MDFLLTESQGKLNGKLLGNKREYIIDRINSTGEHQKHYAEGKKPDTEVDILYDSTSVKFHSEVYKASHGLPGSG